jgi:hypothetical protein
MQVIEYLHCLHTPLFLSKCFYFSFFSFFFWSTFTASTFLLSSSPNFSPAAARYVCVCVCVCVCACVCVRVCVCVCVCICIYIFQGTSRHEQRTFFIFLLPANPLHLLSSEACDPCSPQTPQQTHTLSICFRRSSLYLYRRSSKTSTASGRPVPKTPQHRNTTRSAFLAGGLFSICTLLLVKHLVKQVIYLLRRRLKKK